MFRPLASSVRQTAPRRGALLIAVLGLLTLFAIFALFFVFYADAEATSSRIHREAQSPGSDGDFPVEYGRSAFNQTLSLIIFDDTDYATGVLNPLRGHSLARSMYGGLQGNSAPFSGGGTFHENAPHGLDRATWPNFSAPFVSGPNTLFLDPEYAGFRTGVEVQTNQLPGPLGRAFIPKNAPYTYPDLKDLILASLSPTTGEVLVPSLHRNWLFNANNPNPSLRLAPWNPNDPTVSMNTDWVTPEGRTRILRPRPIDQLTTGELSGLLPIPAGLVGYPSSTALYNLINTKIASGEIMGYPKPNADGSYSGDVQNLVGGVGVQKNDSILIDIGMAPKLWNGRWIKPLASILLTDLDSLLNLNVHGNLRGINTHGSNAGFGPNEVNLGALLGNAEAANVVRARYGIQSWSANTSYAPGARVMNYGNFYQNVAPAPGLSGPAPGPTSTYPLASPYPDGAAMWVDISLPNGLNTGIPRNANVVDRLPFDRSGTRVPSYSQVNFDAGGSSPTITYPSFPGNGFSTNTSYTTGPGGQTFYDDNVGDTANYAKYLNHPLLFNVNDWPSGNAGRRTYPLSDTKRFNLRYAADRTWYTETDVWQAQTANASLIGLGSPYVGGSYRLDPAHTNRLSFTSLSTNLDLPYIPANFDPSIPGPLVLPGGQFHPTNAAFAGAFPSSAAAIAGGQDFTGPANLKNQRAAVGPVDLNRPLADYRNDTTQPLSNANIGNAMQAWADRHNLARDIFARLILATGANASVDASGNVTIAATPGNPDYNALRYLAQLAANIVDLNDSDDVSTVFVWNPAGSVVPLVDATSVTILASAPSVSSLNNQVVFGVEKPRLVINEAYGEITNDPGEVLVANTKASNNARVRFWVELKNPTSTPYTVPGAGPLGSGGATLHNGTFNPYQLVVTQVINPTGTIDNRAALGLPGVNPDVTNVAGTVNIPPNGGFTFDFAPVAGNAALQTVLPVNNTYAPANGSPGFVLVGPAAFSNPHTYGAAMVPIEFNPNAIAPYNTQMIAGNLIGMGVANSQMEYNFGAMPAANTFENAGNMNPYRRHAVLLRRLANPYVASSATNPFVTVDVMDYVPAFDAVARGGAMGDMMNRTPKGAAGITNAGFEPMDNGSGGTRRYSVGKVQPYAGAATASAVMNDVDAINSYPQSMVVRQNPNPATNDGEPLHTFFRMNGRNAGAPAAQTYNNAGLNGGETIMAPFDAFVHFDRPLVNQLELFSLQATKPHEVTQYTLRFVAANQPPLREMGLAPWLGITGTAPGYDTMQNRTNNGLYRAFESLRVKPWTYGTAAGGKVHGKINLNTIQDSRVLSALLDPRTGNYFTAAEVTALWTNMINSSGPTPGIPYRTMQTYNTSTASGSPVSVPLAGPSYDDVPNPAGPIFASNPPYDRPFRSFAAPEFAPSGTTAAYRNGGGLQDTLLRTYPNGTPLAGQPLAWSTNTNVMLPPPAPNPVSYADTGLQSEMLRKMLNNTTTVSHAFGVTITIVFHEVRMSGTSMMMVDETTTPATYYPPGGPPAGRPVRYLIGREAFKDAPGDLRQQFYSIVDRSNLVLTTGGVVHSQPISAALAQSINPATPNAPNGTNPPGYNNNPVNSWNVYLENATSSGGGGQPYPPSVGSYTTTVYADGKPFPIRPGDRILIGVGVNNESLIVNHVNQDGSLNIGGAMAPTQITKPHAAGELVSNFVTGNPGPVSSATYPNPANPGPFDPIAPTSTYQGIVPYAQRVR